MTLQEMMEMGLNTGMQADERAWIIRVPGGWIYEFTLSNHDGGKIAAHSAVFVPLSPLVPMSPGRGFPGKEKGIDHEKRMWHL